MFFKKYSKKEITEQIVGASRIAFQKIIAEKQNEHFFAFALVTLDDVLSCYVYANSYESHNRTIAKSQSLIEAHELSLDDFKWEPAEWEYQCIEREAFDNVYELSEQNLEKLGHREKSFERYKQDFIDCMIEAMRQLKREGLFGSQTEELTLFTTILDSFMAKEVEEKSSKALNNQEVHSKYMTVLRAK